MGDSIRFCSNCKKNVSRANHATHTVHCQRNVITCSLCQEAVLRSHYQQHLESNHSAINCEFCGQKIDGPNLFSHQNEECLQRLVVCKYCEIEVIAKEISGHVEYCGARTDRCKGCSKFVQSRYLQFHYEHDHKYLSPSEKEDADAIGSEGEEDEECPICLGPITLPLALECGHVFCMVCVKGIANTTKNCAICRREIQRDMLMDIRFCREEDVIKNYVNKPKHRKVGRSHSVPSKPSRKVAKTTQEYDDMVSALISARTAIPNCRYQRPSNTHTPTPYTPYCYATASTSCSSATDSCADISKSSCSDQKMTESSYCSKQVTSSVESTTTRSRKAAAPAPPAAVPTTTSSQVSKQCSSSASVESCSAGMRPRRPTTLALKKDEHAPSYGDEGAHSSRDSGNEDGDQMTQIEYDRWLAFQIARAEDDKVPHRLPMRRSQSMPEHDEGSLIPGEAAGNSTKENSSSDSKSSSHQSRLPPASPRGASSSQGAATFSSSNSSYGSSLTKSSSDSSANGSTNGNNGNSPATGARPKSSTGLKKRVSFKEDVPPVKREAPVMLPCEFCEEMFCERDFMRHQTSCDKNETKNPREFLESRRSSVSSPTASSPGLLSPNPTQVLSSKPPSLPINRGSESPSRPTNKLLKTPPQSPSPRPKLSSSPSIPHLNESDNSQANSRHTSLSPGPGASMSSSSGIGSATSSFSSSSVSTTPSTSSSASPVPTPIAPDNQTDIEGDLEEEAEIHTPRKGRLLSSAIASWRSISASKQKERSKYMRSNTAPLEFTECDSEGNTFKVSTSSSASQLPPIPPPADKSVVSVTNSDEAEKQVNEEENDTPQVFIRAKNKYPAPPPPPPTKVVQKEEKPEETIICDENSDEKPAKLGRRTPKHKDKQIGHSEKLIKNHEKQTKSEDKLINTQPKHREKRNKESVREKVFKFDSKPVMNGNVSDTIPCEFCKAVLPPEKFQRHQAVCKAALERQKLQQSKSKTDKCEFSKRHESSSFGGEVSTSANNGSSNRQQESSTPLRRRDKGPAPEPPSLKEGNKSFIGRSNSLRERSSSCIRSYDYEASPRRLERASSIRETSYSSRDTSPLSKRWSWSRESLVGRLGGIESSSVYSGDSLSSSTTSLNNYSVNSSSRTSYSNLRDDYRTRRAVTTLGLSSYPNSVFLGGVRSRERPLSRHRPSSYYGSRFSNFGDNHLFSYDKRRLLS